LANEYSGRKQLLGMCIVLSRQNIIEVFFGAGIDACPELYIMHGQNAKAVCEN